MLLNEVFIPKVLKIVEYHGRKCFIPTTGNCFKECNNFLTGKDYIEELLKFIGTEQRRSNVMTSAGIQPFFKKNNINISCLDGTRINPRNNTQRNKTLFIHNNHSCLI